jgi:nicotinate-nucleotide pyrophosphorylase (carboxylating)
LEAGQKIAKIEGPAKTLLSLERTLLNFLGHLCGIASLTRKYVNELGGSPTKILATRKTLPGLRELQLAAVVAGGGAIHRRSLSDGILIKDNHQFLSSAETLVKKAHQVRSPLHGIEIEVQDISTLPQIISLKPDVIMLDNLGMEKLREAVTQIRSLAPQIRIEVSGGIQISQIKEIAALKVDYISVGKITHSANNLDLTLDTQWKTK